MSKRVVYFDDLRINVQCTKYGGRCLEIANAIGCDLEYTETSCFPPGDQFSIVNLSRFVKYTVLLC